MYVYFVRLTSYQLNTLYPQQLVTLTLDSTCHPSWRTWHSYRTTWSQHSQRHSSATSVQPFFLVSNWGCSTPRNTCTELPTQQSDSAHPGTTIHTDTTRLSPGRTSPSSHPRSQLIILGSGSYTKQSLRHAIARVHAFTRPSSNSPRAPLTDTTTPQHPALSEYVLRACHRTIQRNTSAVHHNRRCPSARIFSQPTHCPTLNFSSNPANFNRLLVLRSPNHQQQQSTIALSYVSYLQLLPLMI